MPTPGQDEGGITTELKLRLNSIVPEPGGFFIVFFPVVLFVVCLFCYCGVLF
jgi:hypothetical protein